MVDGRVQIWLVRSDGELLATMWPGEYRARLEPLVIVDEEKRVIPHGGEPVHVVAGFLPPDDSRAVGHDRGVFFVSQVLGAAPPL